MATLRVRGADYSVTRQKAYEDAKKMQAVVNEECVKTGKEMPPYELQELIGKGSFGRVYKAEHVQSSEVVAVKIIDIEESDTLNPKLADTYGELLKEINALKLLRDGGAKNVNYILDALPVGQSMWMITEYCAGGSVATLMKPTAPGGLQEKWIIPILREAAEAIFWVHRQGIIHRDIKCANVLVTETGGVQLCDFGVAGVIENKFDKRSTMIGTPHWMAPELFNKSTSYGTEVDIWAFGAMVFEIASGLPPNVVAGVTFSQLGNYLKQHTPRLEGDKYAYQLKDLVAFCLVDDPTQRPPIEQVQRHPYIFGTEATYPTSSLALLVKGYKLWEAQGGTRKSLFAPGGAQGPPALDQSVPAGLVNDEWNFSTTVDFDRSVFDKPDSQAVFDVYGSQVDYSTASAMGSGRGGGRSGVGEGDSGSISGNSNFSGGSTPRPSGMKGRRRQPPPQLPAVKVPLEKVFDPNTITNYKDNSGVYYGIPPPPPTATTTATSDLPLRDDSLHSTLRESLIDLDASQIDLDEPSRFADMETIRAGPGGPRISVEYDYSSDDWSEHNRPPLSDPADLPNNRRTQEWKFPTMPPPASANPDMSRFPLTDDERGSFAMPPSSSRHGSRSNSRAHSTNNSTNNSISISRPTVLVHSHADTTGPASQQGYDLMVPSLQGGHASRMSVSSLIDLDESLPDPLPEMTRPSTANSDAVSVTGSDMGMANPFDLERHASLYQPISSTNREPSIYVSDDSEFAHVVAATIPGNSSSQQQQQQQQNAAFGQPTGLGLPGLVPGFAPPSLHIDGVGMMGEPDDEAGRSQRRAVESYLNTTGVYSGDEFVDLRRAAEDMNTFTTGYRDASNSGLGRGGGGSSTGGPSVFGQRMSRSNGSSSSSRGIVGMAYSTDDGTYSGVATANSINSHSTNTSISISNSNANTNFAATQNGTGIGGVGDDAALDDALSLPPLPGPPSPHIMQGLGSREEVGEEMKRLLGSFKQHLSFTHTYVTSLPVRRAGVSGTGPESQVEG